MDSNKLKVVLVVIFAAFAALYLGIAAATAQMEAIAWVVGVLGFVFVLVLGKHVWVLIPVCLALGGNINLIPGSPAPWWGAVGVVGTIFTMRFFLRTSDFQFRFTWLEFAIFIQIVAIGQAFVRNPTGLSILGGDVVGGKPYIIFGFAFAAYALLSVVRTDLKIVRWAVIFAVLMAIVDGGLMLMSVLVPALAMKILPIYSGVSFGAAASGREAGDTADSRLSGAREIGEPLGVAAFTIFRPMSTLNPLRLLPFLLMVSSLGFVLLSGYRSILIYLAIVAVVSSLIRRKLFDVVFCGTLGLFTLTFLVVTDTVQKLPFGAQRILSELPVSVRPDAREAATKSSDWRFEMWRLALTTDRYISNKWLGDGFAFRADELAVMQASLQGDGRGSARFQGQDVMMAKGSYHGFHVETIRMTGAFGLLCALIGLGIFFRYAWIQIQYFRGRPEWGYILWICIPFLIHPFFLMLVFGAYRAEFPQILVAAGLLKVLDSIRVREIAETKLQISRDIIEGQGATGLLASRFSEPLNARR